MPPLSCLQHLQPGDTLIFSTYSDPKNICKIISINKIATRDGIVIDFNGSPYKYNTIEDLTWVIKIIKKKP